MGSKSMEDCYIHTHTQKNPTPPSRRSLSFIFPEAGQIFREGSLRACSIPTPLPRHLFLAAVGGRILRGVDLWSDPVQLF